MNFNKKFLRKNHQWTSLTYIHVYILGDISILQICCYNYFLVLNFRPYLTNNTMQQQCSAWLGCPLDCEKDNSRIIYCVVSPWTDYILWVAVGPIMSSSIIHHIHEEHLMAYILYIIQIYVQKIHGGAKKWSTLVYFKITRGPIFAPLYV